MQQRPLSILDALELGDAHSNPTIRQYAKSARQIFCTWRGFGNRDLAEMPADLKTYDRHAPRYSKRNETLKRQLIWKKETYQQYQRRGRLLIEHLIGERAAKVARKAITNDGFAELSRRAGLLAEAGLIDEQRVARLSTITDLSRAADLQLVDLSNPNVVVLRANAPSANMKRQVVRGAGFLDELRIFPDLACLLPAEPIGPIESCRRRFRVPKHLQKPLERWIDTATTIHQKGIQDEEVREDLAKRHAPGSRGIFQAALRNYLDTLGRLRPFALAAGLADLFAETDVHRVAKAWEQASGKPGGLCARTMYQYMSRMAKTLECNGCATQAAIVATAIQTRPMLREGKAATRKMSAKTEAWCLDLVTSEDNRRIFEMQHWEYERRAREALAEAEAADLDLVALVKDPKKMKQLKAKRRRLAKQLLRRARSFGVCAAFAAIELEGACLREENTLGLVMAGPKSTFFDHSGDKTNPHFRIQIPNELLKNGWFMTERGQELPPIHIRQRGPGDAGLRILRFYIDRIRKLFPGHQMSNMLFPNIGGDGRPLCAQTFSNWLLDCSVEVGFRLTSHNFRHGICSIRINDEPNSIDELANLLGDTPATIRRYYAFLDRPRLLDTLQDKTAANRARHRGGPALAQMAA